MLPRPTRHLLPTPLGYVHAVSQGERRGTPIVLLHQTPRSSDEYAEVMPLLAKHYWTIALDTPGYGCSDPVPGQPRIEDYARAVRAVLAELRVQRAVFVGHHTGAVIAVELAAAYPELVDRVVLSGPVNLTEAVRAELRPSFIQWRVKADGSHFTAKWTALQRWSSDPALMQRLFTDQMRAGEASEQGHLAVLAYRMEERLPLVRCPALLIFPSRDPFAGPERAKPIAAAFRPSRSVTIDASVFAPNEAPEAFAHAVLDYLNA